MNDQLPSLFDEHGAIRSNQERREMCRKKGICDQCGRRTHEVRQLMFLARITPLTNENVRNGICLVCHPENQTKKKKAAAPAPAKPMMGDVAAMEETDNVETEEPDGSTSDPTNDLLNRIRSGRRQDYLQALRIIDLHGTEAIDFDFVQASLFQPPVGEKIDDLGVMTSLVGKPGCLELLDRLVAKMPQLETLVFLCHLSQGSGRVLGQLRRHAEGQISLDWDLVEAWLRGNSQITHTSNWCRAALHGGEVVKTLVQARASLGTDALCSCLYVEDGAGALRVLQTMDEILIGVTKVKRCLKLIHKNRRQYWPRMLTFGDRSRDGSTNSGFQLLSELVKLIPCLAEDVMYASITAPLRGFHRVGFFDVAVASCGSISSIAAAKNGMLYCCPAGKGSNMLEINPFTHETAAIKCDVDSLICNESKWEGIVACSDGRLYCAPHSASVVLAFDPSIHKPFRIYCGSTSMRKWHGIAEAPNGKLYCAPFNESKVLVTSPSAGKCSFIECGVLGEAKWCGIAAGPNGKLYCAPFDASEVLVIDPQTEECETIDCGIRGLGKWSGIALGGDGKLYCSPFRASAVLTIDPSAGECSMLPLSVSEVEMEFQGVAAGGDGKLYCAPCAGSKVLVIDPLTNTCSTMGYPMRRSFNGIAKSFDGTLYCASFDSPSTYVLCLHPPVETGPSHLQQLETVLKCDFNKVADLLRTRETGCDRTPLSLLLRRNDDIHWCLPRMPGLAPEAFVQLLLDKNPFEESVSRAAAFALTDLQKVHTEELLLEVHEHEGRFTTAWHRLVTLESLSDIVYKVARALPRLQYRRDPNGLSAYVLAHQKCRDKINQAVLFCGKYKLGEKLHQSATCVVVLAQLMPQHSDKKNVSKTSNHHDLNELSGRMTIWTDEDESMSVVIKFMVDMRLYHREIEQRIGLDSSFIIPVLESSHDIGDWAQQAEELQMRGGPYPYGIVMPAAERNLMVVLLQERVSYYDACRIHLQLAMTLKHLHEQNKLHADFKPLNVVRMHDSTWHLIDFDATVQMGSPVGTKISSAYCPPEMTTIAHQEKAVEGQVQLISSSSSFNNASHSHSFQRQNMEDEAADIVLRRYTGEGSSESPYRLVDDHCNCMTDVSYELIRGDPSFDLWSYGVVLYRTLARKSLFEADASDNLASTLELRRLHFWSYSDVEAAMGEVDLTLQFEFKEETFLKRLAAKELVGWLLQPDPCNRPRRFEEVLHHAFFQNLGEDVMIPSAVAMRTWVLRNEWRMSKLHRAAAEGSVDLLLEESSSDEINSRWHVLGKTPLHLAAEEGHAKVVETLIQHCYCDIGMKDFLGRTAVHTVLYQVVRLAENRHNEAVSRLVDVLEVFLLKRRSAFKEKVGETELTGFEVGRTCKVKKVRDLFKGVKTLLNAIECHDGLSVNDFGFWWAQGAEQECLKEAVFKLLKDWAFNDKDGTSIESKREYLCTNIFPLKLWEETSLFQELRQIAQDQMEVILKRLYAVRDQMVRDSRGGRLVQELASIKGTMHLTIPVAAGCAAAGRYSESMKTRVDEEVLVPLMTATAAEVLHEFEARLKDALDGQTVFIAGDADIEHTLRNYPDWQRWCKVASIKRASRIREKVKEYSEEKNGEWPFISQVGDVLRAMVVCRGDDAVGEYIYRTWQQLQKAFNIREGHGRVKNNFVTAGTSIAKPGVCRRNIKPPDVLINAVFECDGAMPMITEIQVHHEKILKEKENSLHLLYEIARADSVTALCQNEE